MNLFTSLFYSKTPQQRASEELQRIIDANYRAPATVEYRRRRAAAKLGVARKSVAS